MSVDEYSDLDDLLPSFADSVREFDPLIAQARSHGLPEVTRALERKKAEVLVQARQDAAELRRLVGPGTAPDDSADDGGPGGDAGEVARLLREHKARQAPKTKGRIRRV